MFCPATWYIRFSTGMALYGFTRGYRAEYKKPNMLLSSASSASLTPSTSCPRLLSHRVTMGMINGFIYSLPGWNIVYLSQLTNRVEIEWMGLSPADYPDAYHEGGNVWCLDVI